MPFQVWESGTTEPYFECDFMHTLQAWYYHHALSDRHTVTLNELGIYAKDLKQGLFWALPVRHLKFGEGRWQEVLLCWQKDEDKHENPTGSS